jgi:hypothetical protein
MRPSPMLVSPLPLPSAPPREQPRQGGEQGALLAGRQQGTSESETRADPRMQRASAPFLMNNPMFAGPPPESFAQARGFFTPQHNQQQDRAPPEPMGAAQMPQMHAQRMPMPAPPFAQSTPQFGPAQHAPPPYAPWTQWPQMAPPAELRGNAPRTGCASLTRPRSQGER